MTLFFITLAIILAVSILFRNYDIRKQTNTKRETELHVTNLDKGGVFKLTGVGKHSDELNLIVLEKHLYQEGDFYWFELECDSGNGDKVWVEVEDDDSTIVSVVLEKLHLNDIALVPGDLETIDDNESGTAKYNNIIYQYSDSGKATFFKRCDDRDKEDFYYWDFTNGNHTISIEKWANDYKHLVFYSQIMNKSQVTVYKNSGKGV